MQRKQVQKKHRSRQLGFTLVEVLVSMGLAGIIFTALTQQYSFAVALSYDSSVRTATILEAQALLQSIGLELRMVGNGVPFDQANFQIGDITLSDPTVTEPLDAPTATATNLSFRLNETGDVYLLAADFDPTASLDIVLTDVSSLQVNDPVYLSNSVVSGLDGLSGVITAVDVPTKTVTIGAGYVARAGASFDMGSILEEVSSVIYTSSGNTITRDSGFGPVIMGRNSTLTFDYLDQAGTSIALPLTNNDVISSLRSVRVTINHTGDKTLKTGESYTTTVSQVFGIRNLNYVF